MISRFIYQMDHEIIFDICENHIPLVKSTIQKIIRKEEKGSLPMNYNH